MHSQVCLGIDDENDKVCSLNKSFLQRRKENTREKDVSFSVVAVRKHQRSTSRKNSILKHK